MIGIRRSSTEKICQIAASRGKKEKIFQTSYTIKLKMEINSTNGHANGTNGVPETNGGEDIFHPKLTVVQSRATTYLLTKLRDKGTKTEEFQVNKINP